MQRINKERQARKKLCKELNINNKQLKKRRILRNYIFKDDNYIKFSS